MVVESQQYDSLKPQCVVCVDDGIDDPVDEDDVQHQLQDEGKREKWSGLPSLPKRQASMCQ